MSLSTWRNDGVSALSILNNEDLYTQDQNICALIIDPSKERFLSDLDVVQLIMGDLYDFRESALMVRSADAMQKIIESRDNIKQALEKRGWENISHPYYPAYIDFITQSKINWDTLAEASFDPKHIEIAKENHSELEFNLKQVKDKGLDNVSFQLKQAFLLADPVLARYCRIPDLIGDMIYPEADLNSEHPKTQDSREYIEHLRRNLQRRILHKEDKGVEPHIIAMKSVYVRLNIEKLRYLDFMMPKNAPFIMRDYHDWVLYNELGQPHHRKFHLEQFLRYTALAYRISSACGTPEDRLLPKQILPMDKNYDKDILTHAWTQYAKELKDKSLIELRDELILTLKREEYFPISINSAPKTLSFYISNRKFNQNIVPT